MCSALAMELAEKLKEVGVPWRAESAYGAQLELRTGLGHLDRPILILFGVYLTSLT